MNATIHPTTDAAEDVPMPAATKPTVAPLSRTAWMPLLGTLIWIGPLWLVTALGNAIAMWALVRWGTMDQSLWLQGAAGWQRWPLAAAGFTVVAVFLPMFVTNGSTRRRLGQSAMAAMSVMVVIATAVITLGFVLERLVYDRQDWTQAVSDDSTRTIADIGLATVAIGFLLALTACFLGGWMLAVGLYRYGWLGLVPFFLLGMIPIVVVEFLVVNTMDATQFGFLDSVGTPSLWVGIPVSIAVLLLAAVGVTRGSRSIVVE